MALTALIIDDEPLARQELLYLLQSAEGIEVLAQGSNGIEAVEQRNVGTIYRERNHILHG